MKICFLGCGILNAIEGNITGGAEKQQALIIQGLKASGSDIIVLDYYLREPKVVNGLNVYPAWGGNTKSFLTKLKYIYLQIKSYDIITIYVRGTQLYAAVLYLYFKIIKSDLKLYWGIAGDHDLTSKYSYLRVRNAASWYAKFNKGIVFNISSYLLFNFSDVIICQTTEQIEMCKSKSRNKAIVKISNIYSGDLKNNAELSKGITADAIWVGKFTGNKGEDVLLQIAKDIPEIEIICLGHATIEYAKTETYQEIKRQKNLNLIGRVPAKDVGYFMSSVDFVLNTSISEGLSNVFLEGWDLEKPIISYVVNPNKYLTEGKAGFCAQNSYPKLIDKLQKILGDKNYMKYHGLKGKEILIQNHNPELILAKYKNLFLNN